MLEIDMPKTFELCATRIARIPCFCLLLDREALATPIPSRTVRGERCLELRETATDIWRIEVKTMQGWLGQMI